MRSNCYLLAFAALLTACTQRSTAPRLVRVAAAADLRYAFEEITAAFAVAHPDTRVEVTYGSSGNFAAQIANGAPIDLYLSADRAYVQSLIDQGLATPRSSFAYARGRLVLWLPDGSPCRLEAGLKVLSDPRIRTVSIANPTHAPYGRAAIAALRSAGVYEEVAPKLALGENISQAAQFLETGAADAGLIALSLAVTPALRSSGRYREVPAHLYPALDQTGVVLGRGRARDAAELLRDFLVSEAGRAILRRSGFGVDGI